jgi:hypothetical protein
VLFSYAVAKFLAYWAWSAYGVAQSTPDSSPSGRAIRGAQFGLLRWVIGLLFGIGVFLASIFAGQLLPNGLLQLAFENIWLTYLVVYIPIRYIEWGIIATFLASDAFPLRSRKAHIWILGGIAISILVDLVHPDMIEQGRFCVGRCLC